MTPDSAEAVESLVRSGSEVVRLCADEIGYEFADSSTPFLTDALRSVHESLVEGGLRDLVTLVVSGGIAAAEHVPKAIDCGADAVGVHVVLLVALGCAPWADVRCPCPVDDGRGTRTGAHSEL